MRGAGILESYLTMSYEQLTLDLDLIATVRSLVNGINVSDDSLALNTIYTVGPGGMFLDADHTFEYFRGAFFSPRIGTWQSLEQWQAQGAHDVLARARNRWETMLKTYQEPVLESSRRGELEDFVKRRGYESL